MCRGYVINNVDLLVEDAVYVIEPISRRQFGVPQCTMYYVENLV